MFGKQNYTHIVGIDPGTNTGFAIYSRKAKRLIEVRTDLIHVTMFAVSRLVTVDGPEYFFRVEDARKATFGRNTERDIHKAQGAGSAKRDASIWDDFLKDIGCQYEMLRPRKQFTKLDPETFKQITGWTSRTSNHARDAAMLCFGF